MRASILHAWTRLLGRPEATVRSLEALLERTAATDPATRESLHALLAIVQPLAELDLSPGPGRGSPPDPEGVSADESEDYTSDETFDPWADDAADDGVDAPTRVDSRDGGNARDGVDAGRGVTNRRTIGNPGSVLVLPCRRVAS